MLGERHLLCAAGAQLAAERYSCHPSSVCGHGEDGEALRVFWGRSRWPRNKLREVARRNHGKQLGLQKAKVTRFAGKV